MLLQSLIKYCKAQTFLTHPLALIDIDNNTKTRETNLMTVRLILRDIRDTSFISLNDEAKESKR